MPELKSVTAVISGKFQERFNFCDIFRLLRSISKRSICDLSFDSLSSEQLLIKVAQKICKGEN